MIRFFNCFSYIDAAETFFALRVFKNTFPLSQVHFQTHFFKKVSGFIKNKSLLKAARVAR
jgi:hypothetical protein